LKYLFILNDPPYGTERSYNGLRLARDLLKDAAAGKEVRVVSARRRGGMRQERPVRCRRVTTISSRS